MKYMKKFILIVSVALMMILMPQNVAAKNNFSNVNIEKHERKQQKRPDRARAMRNDDFSMMYKILKNSSFDGNRIDIIRVACIASHFSSKQCAKLLALFSFNDNRIEALSIMAPNIVDSDNYDKILDQFSFTSSKEKAISILLKR